ncbi:hypothetical protein [Prosthecomicrobium sp. N25]|uniref:hypothetical protein n=1 Tax=Prosthecomicrobium sp. N25 TaxID=3129254 RepID=UPI003076D0D2
MKVGLPASVALHAALLAWAVLSLPGRDDMAKPVVDALPVEFVPLSEATSLRLGDKTAKPKEEIVEKTTAQASKDRDGKREGTSKQEEPPPAPPEQKPQEVAALPKEEPKPPAPKPPETKPVARPEPPKEPEPDKPKEAEKAKDLGEGKKPDVKEPPKDQKALEKAIEKAEKEPPKKEPEKKPEPPKPVEKKPEPVKTAAVQPAQPSQTKSQFDSREISDILNRNKTGTAASTTPRTASLGTATGQNSAVKMTQNEVDALVAQIKKCWNPPIGASEANLKVTMRFALNQDGSVSGRPQPIEAPAHPLGVSLARSAERAILQCGPYKLPADKYQAWADVAATFDPKDL